MAGTSEQLMTFLLLCVNVAILCFFLISSGGGGARVQNEASAHLPALREHTHSVSLEKLKSLSPLPRLPQPRAQEQDGGRPKPQVKETVHRLAIVIPFRDREAHLATFLQQASDFIAEKVQDFRVYVIDQQFGELFNRGLLMNIGFVIAAHDGYDYFAFHDVDMIPIHGQHGNESGPTYAFPYQPFHAATCAEQFDWRMPYESYVGGVLIVNRNDMLTINGFPNRYWGWGAEDDEINLRISKAGLEVGRPTPLSIGSFKSLSHARAHGGAELYRAKKMKEMEQLLRVDGVSNVVEHFHVLGIHKNDKLRLTRVSVDVWPLDLLINER